MHNERSAVLSANNCQGQLQTPESVCVPALTWTGLDGVHGRAVRMRACATETSGSEHGVRPIPCQTVIKPSFLLNTCSLFLRIHFRNQPLNGLSCNAKVLKVNFVVCSSMRVLSAAHSAACNVVTKSADRTYRTDHWCVTFLPASLVRFWFVTWMLAVFAFSRKGDV